MKHDATVLFDKDNIFWTNRRYINEMMVRSAEERLNLLLQFDGEVCLNKALIMLGFPVTKASGILGWKKDISPVIEFNITMSEDKNDPDIIIQFEGLAELY